MYIATTLYKRAWNDSYHPTNSRIFELADQLDAADQNPTLAVIRKALGGGGYTAISHAMNEWRAKKAATETPICELAPKPIAELLEQFGT